MINLYISLYPTADIHRFGELIVCLEKNLKLFDRVFVLTEDWKKKPDSVRIEYKLFKNPKIIKLPIITRPTFRHFFSAMQKTCGDQDINVIANSDIYFKNLSFDIQPGQCYALTRYDDYTGDFLNRNDSQDTWIFRGKLPHLNFYCEFPMGVPGCDNRLAYELARIGYEVTNPSLTIKTFHMHKYPTMHDRANKVEQPYLRIFPTHL